MLSRQLKLKADILHVFDKRAMMLLSTGIFILIF